MYKRWIKKAFWGIQHEINLRERNSTYICILIWSFHVKQIMLTNETCDYVLTFKAYTLAAWFVVINPLPIGI